MAPASTGSARRRRRDVIKRDQGKRGVVSFFCFLFRLMVIVLQKFIDARMDLTPAKWREKIVMSTDLDGWNQISDKGGYTVHPVPAPPLFIPDKIRPSAGRTSQNLRLFSRG